MVHLLRSIFPDQITTGFVVSQILSLLAVATIIIGYLAKKRTYFLITQIIANCLIATTYFLLGSMFGCIGIAIANIRTITFFIYEKKNKCVPYWLIGIFIALVCIDSIIFWNSYLDLLCLVAINLFTIAFRVKKDTIMKSILFSANLLFLLFNLFNYDIVGAINKTIELVTLILSIVRHISILHAHHQKTTPKKEQPQTFSNDEEVAILSSEANTTFSELKKN